MSLFAGLAQLAERSPCKRKVIGSSPVFSSMKKEIAINTCMGNVAVTINTRYENLNIEHFMSLAHFPRTGVMEVYL